MTQGASEHLRQVARGGLVGLLGSAFAAVCGLALTVLVTRGLPAGEAGLFFAVVALFVMVATVSGLGVDTGLARFLLRLEAQGRGQDVRRAVVVAAVPAGLVACAVTVLVVLLAGPIASGAGLGDEGATVVRLAAPALPCCVLADVMLAATRAFGQMGQTAVVDRVLRAGAQVAVAAVVLSAGAGPAALALGWSAVYAGSLVLAAAALRRCLRARPKGAATVPERSLAREFWSFTWPRGVAGLAQVAVQRADIVLVTALLSPLHGALYTAATRFVAVGQMANQAIHHVLQSRFTLLLLRRDDDSLGRTFSVTTAWAVLLVWPVYLVVGAAAPVYLAIFGEEYVTRGAVVTVAVMASTMLLAVASGPVDTLLLMAGRSGLSMVNGLVALAVDVAACLVLVPRVGIAGAALAWALALAVRCSLGVWQVRRAVGLTRSMWAAPALAGGAALACFGVPGLLLALRGDPSPGPVLLVAVAGSGAYAVLLVGLRRPLGLGEAAAAVRRRAGREAATTPTATAGDPAQPHPGTPPLPTGGGTHPDDRIPGAAPTRVPGGGAARPKESDEPCLLET